MKLYFVCNSVEMFVFCKTVKNTHETKELYLNKQNFFLSVEMFVFCKTVKNSLNEWNRCNYKQNYRSTFCQESNQEQPLAKLGLQGS